MRAKEYAAKFNANPTSETLQGILDEFIKSTKTLVEQRHCQTDAACLSVLTELEQKWQAFSRLTGIPGDGYARAIKAILPALYMYWKKD